MAKSRPMQGFENDPMFRTKISHNVIKSYSQTSFLPPCKWRPYQNWEWQSYVHYRKHAISPILLNQNWVDAICYNDARKHNKSGPMYNHFRELITSNKLINNPLRLVVVVQINSA